MKHSLIITGALLCSAFLPAMALADDLPTDYTCGPIRDNNLDAISAYAKQVLERADDGLTHAKAGGATPDFLSIMPGWMLSIASAWAGLTDTSTQRTDSVAELRSVSACLHFDLTLIDCKIDEVRKEIRTQSARGSFVALIRLTSLLQFLNDRREQLTIGALDPQYPDPSWGSRYSFDAPSAVWCTPAKAGDKCVGEPIEDCTARGGAAYQTLASCEEYALPKTGITGDKGRLCPFDANYAPAFDNGFGCDVETMEPRKVYPPIAAELESLKAINTSLEEYRKTAVEAMELQNQMNKLFGKQSSSSSAPAVREHLNAFGCGWMGGWCDDDITMRCISDLDCANTCVFSDKVCKDNRAIRCNSDDQCGNDGPCIEAAEPTLRSIRGNFSVDRDQLTILSIFLGTRSQQEISRVFRNDLMTASELPANDQQAREKRARDDADIFHALWRSSIRMAVQAWSRMQARNETFMYPEAIDGPLETAHALSDLHTNIAKIARISSEKTGLRAFVARYASFLSRSCIYRPCSMLLEQAIRLSTTDECFPYTNGEYLDDTKDNPRWEKCKDAAKIR